MKGYVRYGCSEVNEPISDDPGDLASKHEAFVLEHDAGNSPSIMAIHFSE